MTHRGALRAAVMAALATDDRFSGFAPQPAWVQDIDGDMAPAYGVATPVEQSTRPAPDLIARRIDLHVSVKRIVDEAGEDEMDADAAAIEALMEGAIGALCVNWHLRSTAMALSGVAGTRVGRVVLTFSVLVHTEP